MQDVVAVPNDFCKCPGEKEQREPKTSLGRRAKVQYSPKCKDARRHLEKRQEKIGRHNSENYMNDLQGV